MDGAKCGWPSGMGSGAARHRRATTPQDKPVRWLAGADEGRGRRTAPVGEWEGDGATVVDRGWWIE